LVQQPLQGTLLHCYVANLLHPHEDSYPSHYQVTSSITRSTIGIAVATRATETAQQFINT